MTTMNHASTIPNAYFFQPTPSTRSRRTVRRPSTGSEHPAPIASSDELARKQELVCGAILALSLASTVFICLQQLAGF